MLITQARVNGLVAVLLLAVAPDAAWAGSGGVITAPAPGVKATSGLQMTVDTIWVDGTGYRPVRVDISTSPPVPATAERSFLIEVTPRGWRGRNQNTSISQYVDLPQGGTSVSVTLAVPQEEPWIGLDIVVSEDGFVLDDLSLSNGFQGGNPNTWNEMLPAILFIDSDALTLAQRQPRVLPMGGALRGPVPINFNSGNLPDIHQLVIALGYYPADVSVPLDTIALVNLVNQIPQIDILPPQDLPERWLELSSVDVIFISLADLQLMRASNPRQWKSLRAWLATGPTLCVYGVGDRFEQLEEVERLLDLSPMAARAGDSSQFRNWNVPSASLYGQELHWAGNRAQAGQIIYGPTGSMMLQDQPAEPAPPPKPPSSPPLLWRDADLGQVVAIAAEQPFPGDSWQWQWLFSTLDVPRTNWSVRHGVSRTQDNGEYWNFLIPGVGMAPVTTFRVLITLFVVLIGPVNYFALRRWKRLYLLLITVPAGAALVTLGLFAHALLSDGLGVRARVRSFTQLDQATGRAVSFSRQTYYAGLAPSRGLTYPSDTAVYPIEDFVTNYNGQHQRTQQLDWRDHEQRLTRGYLSSRVMAQFMVVRSREQTQAELRVIAAQPPSTSPRVENLLGSEIHRLLLVDENGQTFWAEEIPRGAIAELQPTTLSVAYAKLRPVFAENMPQFPEGFDPNAVAYGPRYYMNSGSMWQGGMPTAQATSVLERKLQECLMPINGRHAPRSYVALVESSPDAPLGYAKAREQASFHVVAGSW